MQLGILIRDWRKWNDLSMRSAATTVGIPIATLSRLERGASIDGTTMVNLIRFILSEGKGAARDKPAAKPKPAEKVGKGGKSKPAAKPTAKPAKSGKPKPAAKPKPKPAKSGKPRPKRKAKPADAVAQSVADTLSAVSIPPMQ